MGVFMVVVAAGAGAGVGGSAVVKPKGTPFN
jgi:hypothetical protein